MTDPSKSGPKKYVKSSEDPFGPEEPVMLPTPITAESRKTKSTHTGNPDPFAVEPPSWTEATQTTPRVLTREPGDDQVHEFDVDVLYSWDQSSGTLSYDSVWSSSPIVQFEGIKSAKKAPGDKGESQHAKLNERLLRGTMLYTKIMNPKLLERWNKNMRKKRNEERLTNRIVVEDKTGQSSERNELISKICDDAITEFMAATQRGNKLLEIKLHCGGDLPPRTKINGIRAQRRPEIEEDYDTGQAIQLYNSKHLFRHLSTCSPALPYPSANAFGRCSVEDYVKVLQERRKMQE